MPRRPPSPPSFAPPLPLNQYLVNLQSPQGSNNWLCKDTEGNERLVEASSKLRRIKSLIIMRDKGGRLVGEIVHIMDKSDIKEWKKAGAWPEGFGEQPAAPTQHQSDDDDEENSDGYEEHEGEDEQ